MLPREEEPATPLRLLIASNGSVRTISLTGNRWTVGRASECNIILRDPTVSRQHLILERDGNEIRFRDLGGSNPALLDGKPTRSGKLPVGQELVVGLTRLVIEERQRPSPVATPQKATVILSREVLDEELPTSSPHSSYSHAAANVLEQIEWTFADLDDLAHTAEPLLELARNLTQRRRGWLGRFTAQGQMETLASTTTNKESPLHLAETSIEDARRIRRPHILKTDEAGTVIERLVMPLGEAGDGMLVLEDALEGAPQGQDLLQMAESLCRVIWHRLQETQERSRLREELERLRFHGTTAHHALLTSSRLQTVRENVRRAASGFHATALIGEPGTEREDLARYLHAESPRRAEPFFSYDASKAATATRDLLGDNKRPGLVQRALGGTIFIDHFSNLATATQEKLVATLGDHRDDNSTRLLIGDEPSHNDHASWTRTIKDMVDGQCFKIPPLREDTRDIIALAEIILSELGTCADGSPRLMTERCKGMLASHDWPGNVRELRITLETAAAKAGNQAITPRHLPSTITSQDTEQENSIPTLAAIERAHIEEVMLRTGGNRSRAAQVLGIASSTLYEKLRKYDI